MPSFLNDENSPIYSNTHDVLDLDPNRHFGLDSEKTRVTSGSIRQVPSSPAFEPYDESSNSSTHGSDGFDNSPMSVNGTRSVVKEADSMGTSSASNGNGLTAEKVLDCKTLSNGNITLPDRSIKAPTGSLSANGKDSGAKESTEATQDPSSSPPSATTIEMNGRPARKSTSGPAPQLQTIPSESEAPNVSSESHMTLTPASPTPDPTQRKGSPHRFSSPPSYEGSAAVSTSSSGLLQPPPPGAALKQRHTLEVPKPAPSRFSRDGMDMAQASGRYSPTVSGTPRRASLSLARRTTRSMQSDMPRDEVFPDEDAARWAEAYRQKRASKRKRKEEEDDDRVLVGTKVDEKHANWVTAYNMLTGIRVSVSRTNAKLDRELTDADFEAKQKSTFDITGNELVPSAKYDFKFKDYAPWVFRRLRHLFRLDPADYLMSLTGKYILSELGSPGKSGSFFYFSRDYKYIIKTIHHAEHKFLRKILKDYYQHVTENPNTLLSQFYGLHRVKMPYGKKIHFVVMNNLFPPHRDIHTTFDLKGSTVGRLYKEEELEKNPRATLKDLNWLRRRQHLELGIQKKRLFLEQLRKDVVLLKRLQIMDYSLLIGIHDLTRGNDENLRGKTLQVFNPGGEKAPDDEQPHSNLLRTPSKMESARKARELRQMIRSERPMPMGQATKMPDELEQGHSRPGFVFNQDDGGFRATHENNDPAEEIYYLGVIDCLTHYGMIKKIENFWKGLTSDKTQISALPPQQYGDRFYHFMEGITMSPEAVKQEEELREQEAISAQQGERSASRTSRRKSTTIPPMHEHLPPAPPTTTVSPEGREVIEKASREAWKGTESPSERRVPDRTLRTNTSAPDVRNSVHADSILPVVQEAAENGRDDADRQRQAGKPALDKALPPTRAPPPTPPKTTSMPAHQKSDSADSGYDGPVNGNGSTHGDEEKLRISRESLRNKTLPPLPSAEMTTSTEDSGVGMKMSA